MVLRACFQETHPHNTAAGQQRAVGPAEAGTRGANPVRWCCPRTHTQWRPVCLEVQCAAQLTVVPLWQTARLDMAEGSSNVSQQ